MKRIWQRKTGGGDSVSTRGTSGTRSGGAVTTGPGITWGPSAERQSRYCKSGSLDNRYGSRTGLGPGPGPHLMSPLPGHGLHLPAWCDVQQQTKMTINPKGKMIVIQTDL